MQIPSFIVRGFSLLLTAVILSGVFAFLRRPRQAKAGKVFLPRTFAVLGVIGTAVFLIPAVIATFSDEPLWLSIILLLFSLFCSSLIIAYINCRITYDDQGFVAKSFFGIKRAFTYDQITGIKENKHETFLYMGKRKVMVDAFGLGGKAFLSLAKKKYRTMHDGKNIPNALKGWDIFNGNVESPVGFIVIYLLITVVLVAVLVPTIVFGFCLPHTEDNTTAHSVCFEEGYISNGDIVLQADGRLYKILFVDSHTPADAIWAICDGETVVTAYCTDANAAEEDGFFRVHAIVDNNTCVLSFEETERLHRENYTLGVVVIGGLLLVWIFFAVCTVMIGRNPQKFSKRVRRIFFKPGYLKLDRTSQKQKKD